MMLIPALTTAALLIGAGFARDFRVHRQRRRQAQDCARQLEYILTLIQGVQKHRGLSGQSDAPALRQREQLAHQLGRQWSNWREVMRHDNGYANAAWQALRAQPTDFQAHCQLIDELLVALALLERALLAGQKKSANETMVLTERCREIEDLGRVRGLSVRAARHLHCPIEMAVPLRYLCMRLQAGTLQRSDPAIAMALREIQQDLLDAQRVAIAPSRCFDLLTPSIDRALTELRQALPTERASTPPSRIAGAREVRGAPVAAI